MCQNPSTHLPNTSDPIWSVTPEHRARGSSATTTAAPGRGEPGPYAGSGLAPAARREPRARLTGAAPPSCSSLRPAPPLPAPPLIHLASTLWSRPQTAGGKGGQGASRWLGGDAASCIVAYHAAPVLPRSERAEPLSGLGAPPWALRREPPTPPVPRVSSLIRHPSGTAAWPAPKPVVVLGGAPEKNDLLILATS
jgi:hypothetical protein